MVLNIGQFQLVLFEVRRLGQPARRKISAREVEAAMEQIRLRAMLEFPPRTWL